MDKIQTPSTVNLSNKTRGQLTMQTKGLLLLAAAQYVAAYGQNAWMPRQEQGEIVSQNWKLYQYHDDLVHNNHDVKHHDDDDNQLDELDDEHHDIDHSAHNYQ